MSGQPSGRVITVPNAAVSSSQVGNDTALFGYVWSEVTIQVAYWADVEFAHEVMIEEASVVSGEEMRRGVISYKERLDRTAVDLDVREGPTVNVVRQESWADSGSGFSPAHGGSRGRRTRSTGGSSRDSTTPPTG